MSNMPNFLYAKKYNARNLKIVLKYIYKYILNHIHDYWQF